MNTDGQQPKFNLILVNFNGKTTINTCLRSILNQTYKNFHLTIIDSKSTDESLDIIKKVHYEYPTIIDVIEMPENLGAGAARNLGLNEIQTKNDNEYIWFIDGDDYLESKKSLELLAASITLNNYPDIVRIGFIDDRRNCKNSRIRLAVSKYDKSNNISRFLINGTGTFRTIIKAKFADIKFSENIYYGTDVAWTTRIFDIIKTHAVLKTPIYHYNRSIATRPVELLQPCVVDLSKINFKTDVCNNYKQYFINKNSTPDTLNLLNINKSTYNISFDELFSNSKMITIDDVRYNRAKDLFSYYKLPIPEKSIGSTDPSLTPVKNCLISHRNIVKKAKENNLPFVLIFEDDAYPCTTILTEIQPYLNSLPADIGVLLLGWSNISKRYPQTLNNLINKITTIISGAHAYIIFKSAYDHYLNATAKLNVTADGIFVKIPNSYMINKPIFIQYNAATSMNKHNGYILYGDHKNPPPGYDVFPLSNEKSK